uniref:UDP-N-acetylglucosamine--N-acetylmuramyl-(pentapeptide) pyrophosphoryl-undecaprenol N-acetylglucosamine transferase n=1 Tax=Acidobacterium capsulatum TaxID=33075 RepID=A0A7V5CS86_9BACT
MKLVIAGGGTGGHIIPALAIADQLTAECEAAGSQAEILFIGTPRGLESKLVPQAGYPLSLIKVGQLNNVSLLTRVRTLLDLPLSLMGCMQMLRKYRPNAVVGVGGYASGPAMLAAQLLRIPTLAFEPNAIPGLANRLIGRRVRAAAVNFAPAAQYFRNAQVTGIPVRKQFFALHPRPADQPPHLLVFGGSQGARVFNAYMPQAAAELLAAVPGLTILHQAGARHAEATEQAYEASGADRSRWRVAPFLDDMPQRFAEASLILARSGASTVAELAAAGKPALLVPFPQAADDHQRKNAEVMVQAGAAAMVLEADLTPGRLGRELAHLLAAPAQLAQMSDKARTLAHPDATEQITQMIRQIAR